MTEEALSAVRKGRKFDQVVAGALHIFLRDGFEGAAVDDIARAAGVSKATLYTYFPDKRILFAEVFAAECRRISLAAEALPGRDLPARDQLFLAGEMVLKHELSKVRRGLYRIILAEVHRFPELGRQFYECGPLQLRKQVAARLTALGGTGELDIADVDTAAALFIQLCRGAIVERQWLMPDLDISEADRAETLNNAVGVFHASFSTQRLAAAE